MREIEMTIVRETSTATGLLADILRTELSQVRNGTTVIHAGHFILDIAEGKAMDHLNTSAPLRPGLADFIDFTRLTWEVACKAVKRAPDQRNMKLIVLANDWQFLSPPSRDRGETERKANQLRDVYYEEIPNLPPYHLKVLAQNNLNLESVMAADNAHWLFSETVLRHMLTTTIAPLLRDRKKADSLGLREHFTEKGQLNICVDSRVGGEYSLLYCGSTNCAGEVVQLLKLLRDRAVTNFINLYPAQCREPVTVGTKLAHHLFCLEKLRVLNVAIPVVRYSRPPIRPFVEEFTF